MKKEDHDSHNLDKIRATTLAGGIALEMAIFLSQLGYISVAMPANFHYRNDDEVSYADRKPPISHRYLAVRSGIGHFWLSGNVITKGYGAAIALASVVTTAELVPTPALPEEDNYCDRCKICHAACPSGFMSPDELAEVRMGDRIFTYSRRNIYTRCNHVCGGYAGLDRSGKWSTWSPSRYPIPDKDEDFQQAFEASDEAYMKRSMKDHLLFNTVKPRFWTEYNCSHCKLICNPAKEIRMRRYQMVMGSVVIIQRPDSSREAATHEKAEKRLARMSHDEKQLYEPPKMN